MTVKLLQTSDWHFGALLENAARASEHAHFLQWLEAELVREPVDALLIMGNLFHSANPPPEAWRAYFDFVADVAQRQLARTIVVVGGSFDSAEALDASSSLARNLGIHVVGALDHRAPPPARALCPIAGSTPGEVVAVVAALPFINPASLALDEGTADGEQRRVALQDRLKALYSELAAQAAERYPGAPLIAAGHLACAGLSSTHQSRPLPILDAHGGLDPSFIFDDAYAHVALGHSRRTLALAQGRAWYSGSPLPLQFDDVDEAHHVLRVEVNGPLAQVTPVTVPRARDILRVKGTLERVLGQLVNLSSKSPLRPWLDLHVHHASPGAEIDGPIQSALARFPISRRPRVLRLLRASQGAGNLTATDKDTLAEPFEVFRRLVVAQHGHEPDSTLMDTFHKLLADTDL